MSGYEAAWQEEARITFFAEWPRSVPELEFPPPVCSICDGDLFGDSEFYSCEKCALWWWAGGTTGQLDDDAIEEGHPLWKP